MEEKKSTKGFHLPTKREEKQSVYWGKDKQETSSSSAKTIKIKLKVKGQAC